MSFERLRAEAGRWLLQAEDDLEAAEALAGFGKHAQAAFLCQQAGEKALKGLWFLLDLDPWGNSLTRLIKSLPDSARERFEPLIPSALSLDKLYIPTRYPDALAELTPSEAYTRTEADQAGVHARAILTAVRAVVMPG
jgi:HEPN domain-containing protein